MEGFTIWLAISLFAILVVFCVISLIKGTEAQQRQERYNRLRKKIMRKDGLKEFGVCNHGISLDKVEEMQVYSPDELGISKK